MDQVPAATGNQIYNLVLTNGATEYPQVLQDGADRTAPSVKAVMFRLQDKTKDFQYSFKQGGPYFDVLAGEVYWKDGMDAYGLTLYAKCATAGMVLDIEVWR